MEIRQRDSSWALDPLTTPPPGFVAEAKFSTMPSIVERSPRSMRRARSLAANDASIHMLEYIYDANGVHPEGGAQRVIAEVVAQAIISR